MRARRPCLGDPCLGGSPAVSAARPVTLRPVLTNGLPFHLDSGYRTQRSSAAGHGVKTPNSPDWTDGRPGSAGDGRGAARGLRVVLGNDRARALTPRACHGALLTAEVRDDLAGGPAGGALLGSGRLGIVLGCHRAQHASSAATTGRLPAHAVRGKRCAGAGYAGARPRSCRFATSTTRLTRPRRRHAMTSEVGESMPHSGIDSPWTPRSAACDERSRIDAG